MILLTYADTGDDFSVIRLAGIGLIAVCFALSRGVKQLCKNYLKRRGQHDDQ